jgi:hypothetical protein
MDLAFNRYANPFLLFDTLISNCSFFDYILTMYQQVDEDKLFDIWLHKVYDMQWEDFLKEIRATNEEVNVEEVVKGTNDVLSAITPS